MKKIAKPRRLSAAMLAEINVIFGKISQIDLTDEALIADPKLQAAVTKVYGNTPARREVLARLRRRKMMEDALQKEIYEINSSQPEPDLELRAQASAGLARLQEALQSYQVSRRRIGYLFGNINSVMIDSLTAHHLVLKMQTPHTKADKAEMVRCRKILRLERAFAKSLLRDSKPPLAALI